MAIFWRSVLVLSLGAVLSAGALNCSPSQGLFGKKTSPGQVTKPPKAEGGLLRPSPAFAQSGGMAIADIAEQAVGSVVNISSEKVVKMPGRGGMGPFFNDPFFEHFFGQQYRRPSVPQERREKSLGSGVIVSSKGIVVTNNHVVEKADNIRVALTDEREFDAELVGTDPESDLAVLRLKGDVKNLRALEFANSDSLRLGDVVLAIGNPFGVGQTVTMGIVSATGRANVGIVDYEDFIQTDAAINPGNSGGALVDMNGKLVGINTAILSRSGGYQGIGFAIPSNMVQSIERSLVEDGRVVRGWLGVVIQDVNKELQQALGLPDTKGVLISDVSPDGPAAKGGIQRGDVILKIDGREMTSTGELRNVVAVAGAKKNVKVELRRKGKAMTLDVQLGERAKDQQVAQIEKGQGALSGLKLGPLNQAARNQYRIAGRIRTGAVVTGVAQGSPASRSGFREGDVIIEFNRRQVKSVGEFAKAYREAKGPIAVLVQRGANTLYLALPKK